MAKTVEWAKLAAKLPWGKDAESSARRKLLFRQFDPNGNGLLSLAEADKGLIELQLDLPKPVIMRAFQASKGVNQETKASNDDFVDYSEFRVFLLYIRQYLELWVMFDEIDSSKDHKITPDEFAAAAAIVGKWGLPISDPAATFKEIDHDGGGVILFDEFAHWAIKQRLKVEGSDNVEQAGVGSGLISEGLKSAAVKGSQRKAAPTPQKKDVDWNRIAQKLPWGTDEKSATARKLLFRQFDPNGNGLLSLAEVDKGVLDIGLGDVVCKAVIMRAFQAAKGVNQSGDKKQNDDYVDSSEFRMLLLYIRQYLELWVMFDAIDADKNKKIEEKEFAAAVALVEKWGLKVEDPAATFKEIDADKGGCILFDEFAHWAISKKLDLEDDDDAPDAGTGSGLIGKAQSTTAGAAAHKGVKKPEQKKPEKMNVNWKQVAEKLPWGQDEAAALARKRLFRLFDPNGNGLLSLAEADKGVVVDLQMGDVCSKQVIMRAFNAAKSVNQSGNKAQNDDYVDISEFRMFLLYLRQYLELWVMFDAMDTNKDKRIEQAEFAAAVDLVAKWGLKIDNPDAVFKQIDNDGGGMILFDEFAHWAIQHKLDLDDDDDAPDAGAGSGLISGAPKPKAGAVKKAAPAAAAPAAKAIDWADVAKKLPWGTDEESVKRRKKLFKVFDPNGNGLLSLAEVDKGVGEDLKMGDVICKAVIMRAFQAAKTVNQSDSKAANDDYVDFTEFRTLLLYLRQYLELWVMFEAIDTNKDKRIDAGEFAAAAKLVETWGMTIKDPAEVFAEIDIDGGGMILFDEFADWAIRKQLDLPDDDDAENAGAGAGVSRTGPDIKVKGLAPKKPGSLPTRVVGAKPASPITKTPVKPGATKPATTTPSRPATKPATPVTAPKPTVPKPAVASPPVVRTKSPTPRASEPKPAWGSSKTTEKKAGPPSATKPGAKPEQKVSVGIKFDANADGAVAVTLVNPDTAASRAGLLVGDILLSMAGKSIASKDDFKAILPTLTPGSTVDISVKRGAEDLALKISF
jgi:Ca2+-binding EF-hand superfamily protein